MKKEINTKNQENSKLVQTVKGLRDNYFEIISRCSNRLREVFHLVGAASEEANSALDDLPGALKWVEGEIDAFGEVMSGQGNFCMLIASCGTTSILEKAGCSHLKIVSKANFNFSPDDTTTTSTEANSEANRFITLIWMKGGRELVGVKTRELLDEIYFQPFHNACCFLSFSYVDILTLLQDDDDEASIEG